MTAAIIDIGTNTVLLLVAQIDGNGHMRSLLYEQRSPRLGNGVDAAKNLQQKSMQRVIDVLSEYKHMMTRFRPDTVVVAGTSAVRDAQNRPEFARLVSQEVGFDLEVLSGDDEAYWTFRGAISGLTDVHLATVVDIGGGSTEIITGTARGISRQVSIDVGSVRMTERFFKHDPPAESELEAATSWINGELRDHVGFPHTGSTLVGVAGTATSLAILDQELHEFTVDAIINYRLTLDRVRALYAKLRKMKSQEILTLSNVMQGRNDVITAGTLILLEIMIRYGVDQMIVSERGVRYGLAIREWEKSLSQQSGSPS